MIFLTINPTIEVLINFLGFLITIPSIILTIRAYSKNKVRSLFFLGLTWFSTSMYLLSSTISYFFLSEILFKIHVWMLIPPLLFIALSSDSLFRYNFDPKKILIIGIYGTLLTIFLFEPDNVIQIVLPTGDKTFTIRNELESLSLQFYLIQNFLFLYYVTKIHYNAPKDLKKKSLMLLLGVILMAFAPLIIFIFDFVHYIPGIIYLFPPIGSLIVTIIFHNSPPLFDLLKDISMDAKVGIYRKLEKNLYYSQERFENLVNTMQELVIEIDSNLKIIYINNAVNEFFNVSKKKAYKMDFTFFLAPNHKKNFKEIISALKNKDRIVNQRLEFLNKNGKEIPFLVNFSKIQKIGNHENVFLIVAWDIHELEEKQRILDEKNKTIMRIQRLETIGTISSGIAHDFNNILQNIFGNVDLLSLSDITDPDDKESIELIKQSCVRGSEIATQILQFTRKDNRKYTIFDLNKEIKDFIRLIQVSIPKRISIRFDLSKEVLSIKGDPSQIQQAIMNIVLNAKDAMPLQGKLIIKSDLVKFDEDYRELHPNIKQCLYAQISIIDNGTGMNKETLNHLFEPFFTTKKEGKGTGLGLFNSYSILKNHNGDLQCYSELGKGTEFRLLLPIFSDQGKGIHENVENVDKVKDEKPDFSGSELILIAEDEPNNRNLFENVLNKAGYNVTLAEDGLKTISILNNKDYNPDLLILDLDMPKKTGYEVLDEIFLKKGKNIKNIPKILITTGFSDTDSLDKLKTQWQNYSEMQTLKILKKPFSNLELLKNIRNILDEKL